MLKRLIAAIMRLFLNPTPQYVESPYGGFAWRYKNVFWYYYPNTRSLCPVGDTTETTWEDRNYIASFLMERGYKLKYPYREA